MVPRLPRVHWPQALHYLTVRAPRGERLFVDYKDCGAILQYLFKLKGQSPFTLHAYCLMPDHFHLLIQPKATPVAAVMQRLSTHYAKYFKSRHGRRGSVFAGRYSAVICQKSAYLRELVRYIHLNPIRSEIVKTISDWPWTSHGFYVNPAGNSLVDIADTLSLFGGGNISARARYIRFIEKGLEIGYLGKLHPPQSMPCLGDRNFIREYGRLLSRRGVKQRSRPTISLSELACGDPKVSQRLLRSPSQSRPIVSARTRFVIRALEAGHKPASLAAFLNRSPSAISKMTSRWLGAQRRLP